MKKLSMFITSFLIAGNTFCSDEISIKRLTSERLIIEAYKACRKLSYKSQDHVGGCHMITALGYSADSNGCNTDCGANTALGIYKGQELVGYAHITRTLFNKDQIACSIEKFFVIPAIQSTGIAYIFMKHILEHHIHICKTLSLYAYQDNIRADKFYKKLGFVHHENVADLKKYVYPLESTQPS